MKTLRKNIGSYIGTFLVGATLGGPLGVLAMQPIINKDITSRLEKMAEENPMQAEDFASRFVSPEDSLFKEVGLYGAKKAAMDYLRKN